ncbi:MAG: preprotein translocase subunit SecG [Candidatus Thiodiazotropha sp. LLP2]
MQTILTVFHIFLAIGLVGLILIQHGKGADMGAAFGSGASGTVFGSKGSGSFLTRATAILAALFFVTSMVMAYFAVQTNEPEGLMERIDAAPVIEAPAPESDLPAVPGTGSSDLPAIPAPDATRETQSEDLPVAPASVSDTAAADVTDAEPVVPADSQTDPATEKQ